MATKPLRRQTAPLPVTRDITSPTELITADPTDIDITRWIVPDSNPTAGFEAAMGGFADVFKGTHSTKGRVALKRPRMIGDDALVKRSLFRLEREAKIWSGIKHEFILCFLGVFKRNGQTYLVSPWVNGGHIRSALERNPRIDRFLLITEIAKGLCHLHENGIVHGDVKALNILYSDDGHPLICDFGLSKVLETMQTSTPMKGAGSPQWLAPELWRAEPKTKKTDVFAFGITIYEVLSGDPPFQGMTYATLYNHVCVEGQRPPKRPTQSAEGWSYSPLWTIANDCWASSPDGRPTMAKVQGELLRLQGERVRGGDV